MNQMFAIRFWKWIFTKRACPQGKYGLLLTGVTLVLTGSLFAQSSALQEKLAAVKQSAAANQQRLHQYQWTETTQLTLKGDPKPPSQYECQYGPDGQVQKTLIGIPPPPPSGRRMRERIVEKKKAEMKQYMQEVKSLLGMYVPPDPQKMQQAFQAGKVSINPAGGLVNLVFRDYAQPGDQMTLSFDASAKKIASLDINTYMGEAKDAVKLQVQMASLPDGTSYAQQSVLTASSKHLVVTTTNSNYQKLGSN